MSGNFEIISTGANDVPRFGGGLYWADDKDDERDYKRGFDSNAEYRDRMVSRIMKKVPAVKGSQIDEDSLKQGKELLKDTGLLDITEFGRAVHAEMEAILSCGRVGTSPRGGTLFSTTFPCHNCAKHIVASGIKRVVYVEPYPKSQAEQLYDDSIDLSGDPKTNDKVRFEPFAGVGPRRFMDLFSLRVSSGYQVVRSIGGRKVDWQRSGALLRVPMAPNSYLEHETLLSDELNRITEELDGNPEETRR
jgi:deoxycytidylate deaminase